MSECRGLPLQDASGQGDLIAAEALKWVGTPYQHQASVLGAGADCLGLVRGVWRAIVGPEPFSLPAYSMDWGEPSGDEVLMRKVEQYFAKRASPELHCGDVLLFRMKDDAIAKHLGIISAVKPVPRFVHAYSGHGVIENSLSEPWRRRIAAVFCFPSRDK